MLGEETNKASLLGSGTSRRLWRMKQSEGSFRNGTTIEQAEVRWRAATEGVKLPGSEYPSFIYSKEGECE
jgi:hypothetical protein